MATIDSLEDALERYEPVIGLEVHAQLNTASKLFSGAPNRFDPERPNEAISAYCIGLPGMLPVLNREALEMAVRAGLALGCTVHERSVFARKQYFYPDLPKGYQISQYDQPICTGGGLEVAVEGETPRRIELTRIHMEEDAGKSTHVKGAPYSLVDFSRAGVPLIEIVSEPQLRSAAEASAYLKELRELLRFIGVCDGNMERGNFRCDANVSIRPRGQVELGDRVELKNINSFRFVEQAIDLEIVRHARILEAGEKVTQETRLFDPDRKETRSMRSKEEAADYRYFPDPDLPPLEVSDELRAQLKSELPELPAARRERWTRDWGLPEEHARAFSGERALADWFDAAVGDASELAPAIANVVKTEVLRELKDAPEAIAEAKLAPEDLRGLLKARAEGKISNSQVKKLFSKLWAGEGALGALLSAEGEQISDPSVIGALLDELFAAHPGEVEKLRGGNGKIAGFFVGQVMKRTKGKADPSAVNQILREKL